MSSLLSMGVCPKCDGGHKSPCYAEYDDGYKCFSCGLYKSYDNHRKAMMGLSSYKPVVINKDMYVPKHTRNTREFSPQILKWLYSFYVYDKLIKKHHIGYVADTGDWGDSVLLPVIKDNEMVFVTRRFFPDKRVLGIGEKQVYKIKNGNKKLIIVEDYISAIRVEDFGDVYCLFGTYLNKTEIPTILDGYNEIIIWLDGDDAGIKGADKLIKQLNYQIRENKRRFPLKYLGDWTITVIKSEEDPKFYSPKEMERYIHG